MVGGLSFALTLSFVVIVLANRGKALRDLGSSLGCSDKVEVELGY